MLKQYLRRANELIKEGDDILKPINMINKKVKVINSIDYRLRVENFSEDLVLDTEVELIYNLINRYHAIIRNVYESGDYKYKYSDILDYTERVEVYFSDKKEFMIHEREWHEILNAGALINAKPSTVYKA